uniref:60S ribosomal protein L44 n=1 Tax=Arcella intermedia TaxID=1963864 RepID=A0A6B2LU26_9EUKA
MVRIPKQRRTLCPRCKTHQPHRTSIYKSGARRATALGQRRYQIKQKSYGGQTRPIFRKKAKTTKKLVLLYTCLTCQRRHQQPFKRARIVELTDEKKQIVWN